VSNSDFSDSTLVLLGHGSTRHEDSCAPVFQHAAELRRREVFAAVREAFWKQDPAVGRVLAEVASPRVFIVPLFISEGYFSEEIIPRELGFAVRTEHATRDAQHVAATSTVLGRVKRCGEQTLHYCPPIGTHDSMTCVLLARAEEVVRLFPFPRAPKPVDTTLFIAGHGTERNESSRKAIERQAGLIRALNSYAGVHGVFMEEAPRIGDCHALAQTRNLIVVPFFISDGLHTQVDIPVLLGEPECVVRQRLASGQSPLLNPTERNGKRVWYAKAVGTEPHIADVILERVREMVACN
jgi:sirohydrochlorin cobaltochelatase